MKSIPAQIIIDESSIKALDETLIKGFGKTAAMKFFGEFNEFLENSSLVVFGPYQVEKESINNSLYLRNLIDQAGSGRKSIKIIKSATVDSSLLGSSEKTDLMNVLISNQYDKKSIFFMDWLNLKEIPDAWDCFSNNRKTTMVVGGQQSIFQSWDDFGLKKFPVRSIVIIDPYLLKDQDEIKINLPRIIDGLVNHENRDYSVKILLIVSDEVPNRFDLNSFASRNSKIISSILNEKFKDKKIQISVAYVNGEYLHDRFIFTNYYYMDAGKGFNVFSGKGLINQKKPNKVTLKFLSSSDAFAEFEEAVQKYCNVVYNRKALVKLEGSLEGNEILKLVGMA
jgi:hypothetical protein